MKAGKISNYLITCLILFPISVLSAYSGNWRFENWPSHNSSTQLWRYNDVVDHDLAYSVCESQSTVLVDENNTDIQRNMSEVIEFGNTSLIPNQGYWVAGREGNYWKQETCLCCIRLY
jgi:hypothetical protein